MFLVCVPIFIGRDKVQIAKSIKLRTMKRGKLPLIVPRQKLGGEKPCKCSRAVKLHKIFSFSPSKGEGLRLVTLLKQITSCVYTAPRRRRRKKDTVFYSPCCNAMLMTQFPNPESSIPLDSPLMDSNLSKEDFFSSKILFWPPHIWKISH